jgi:hypothetical protein
MKRILVHFMLISGVLLTACTMTKRRYNSGFHLKKVESSVSPVQGAHHFESKNTYDTSSSKVFVFQTIELITFNDDYNFSLPHSNNDSNLECSNTKELHCLDNAKDEEVYSAQLARKDESTYCSKSYRNRGEYGLQRSVYYLISGALMIGIGCVFVIAQSFLVWVFGALFITLGSIVLLFGLFLLVLYLVKQ